MNLNWIELNWNTVAAAAADRCRKLSDNRLRLHCNLALWIQYKNLNFIYQIELLGYGSSFSTIRRCSKKKMVLKTTKKYCSNRRRYLASKNDLKSFVAYRHFSHCLSTSSLLLLLCSSYSSQSYCSSSDFVLTWWIQINAKKKGEQEVITITIKKGRTEGEKKKTEKH